MKEFKFISLAGILLGLSAICFAVDRLWIHWSESLWLVFCALCATAVFVFACFLMILTEPRSWAQIVTWVGMAYTATNLLFVTFQWPGGMSMSLYGAIGIITIGAAIAYLIQMPPQFHGVRKALGFWVIGFQLVFIILWYVRMYYLNYVIDQFEPAIPYAEYSIHYMQIRAWTRKYFVIGNGLAMLLPSIYLYIVARKQNK